MLVGGHVFGNHRETCVALAWSINHNHTIKQEPQPFKNPFQLLKTHHISFFHVGKFVCERRVNILMKYGVISLR